MRRTSELTLLPKSPLLITESADEFDTLQDAFEREIEPQGIIEQMYVHNISSIVWEIDRDRGEPRSSAPPTPPCVRVRTRRFEKLR
jgi:hypothetical protein